MVAEACGPLYVTSSIGGSVRWAAPELFRLSEDEHVSAVTTHGDIYSYGSVTLQVRTTYISCQRILSLLFTSGTIRKTTLSSPAEGCRSLDQPSSRLSSTASTRANGRTLGSHNPMLGGGPYNTTKYRRSLRVRPLSLSGAFSSSRQSVRAPYLDCCCTNACRRQWRFSVIAHSFYRIC